MDISLFNNIIWIPFRIPYGTIYFANGQGMKQDKNNASRDKQQRYNKFLYFRSSNHQTNTITYMKHIVVLTGAGISAESGLKTFRDSDGLWEGYNVYDVATPEAWAKDPAMVLDFYNMRRQGIAAAVPNAAHRILAELEQDFLVTIVTQNIDDLHERAGSTRIVHLHGEIFKMRSADDPTLIYPITGDMQIGDTAEDGAQLRPHIVWFGEAVPMIETAAKIMSDADIFILVGSSLQVYPAAGLINYVPPFAPKFVVDRKIPPISGYNALHLIEKPATEGMTELRTLLNAMKD
jgi:NAD-dependent deacetylase